MRINVKSAHSDVYFDVFGASLKINPQHLFSDFISSTTQNVLEHLMCIHLKHLKKGLLELAKHANKSESNFDELYKNKNTLLYEYACLNRDMYNVTPDAFEEMYKEDAEYMSIINQIIQYNSVYGYQKPQESTIVK